MHGMDEIMSDDEPEAGRQKKNKNNKNKTENRKKDNHHRKKACKQQHTTPHTAYIPRYIQPTRQHIDRATCTGTTVSTDIND